MIQCYSHNAAVLPWLVYLVINILMGEHSGWTSKIDPHCHRTVVDRTLLKFRPQMSSKCRWIKLLGGAKVQWGLVGRFEFTKSVSLKWILDCCSFLSLSVFWLLCLEQFLHHALLECCTVQHLKKRARDRDLKR